MKNSAQVMKWISSQQDQDAMGIFKMGMNMDFNNLAEIIENEASFIHKWATSRSEYELSASLNRIAANIREELSKCGESENDTQNIPT